MRYPLLPLATLALASCGQALATKEDPTPKPTANTADTLSPNPANEEEDIRLFLLQEYPDASPLQYALAWNDLDGDGTDEAIVYLVSPYFCGTGGCNTLVLAQAGPMCRKVADISVSRTPISILDSSTKGWKDMIVAVSGGGGPSGNALLRFNGETYPSNPTVPPAEMTDATGTEVIGKDPTLTKIVGQTPSGE